jgi:hypothetical protein
MIVFAFVLLTQAMQCNEDYENEPLYPKNAEGKPEYIYLNTVSAKRFNRYAVRNGWKWSGSFRITEEGNLEKFVFTGNGNPVEYYFTSDSVIAFRYYQDRNVRWRDTYQYDETKNQLNIPSIEYMQVTSLDSLSMETIESVEGIGFFLNFYERMMPFELNARMLGFDEIKQ